MVSSSLVPRDRPILGLLAATLLLVGFVPEAGVAQDAEFVPDRVIVKYRPGATANRGIELGAAVGAQMIHVYAYLCIESVSVRIESVGLCIFSTFSLSLYIYIYTI